MSLRAGVIRIGTALVKRRSLSARFSAPEGPYIYIHHGPLISAAILRPVGKRRMFVAVSPSLVKMAVPLPSVPRFM